MNSLIYVFLVLSMLDGSQKGIVSEPVVVAENVNPEIVCEDQALKMILKEKNVSKFDYACFPPPDFESDPPAQDTIDLIKKDIANHSA